MQGTQAADFWRWAFSSLTDNTLRGDLMEWAVAHLLGIRLSDRGDWTPYDLNDNGITIQVKQSSFLQGWAQRRPSTPRFSGLVVGAWDPDTDTMSAPTLQCDWYVLCLLTCTDAAKWNPLDLDQWVFYVLPRATVQAGGYRSLGLVTLDKLVAQGTAHRLTANELRLSGRSILGLSEEGDVALVDDTTTTHGSVK
jgi:hypothetical protein